MIAKEETFASQNDVFSVQVQGPYGIQDTLRSGLHLITQELTPKHPAHTQLLKTLQAEKMRKLKHGERALGLHTSVRLGKELNIANETKRLAGLPSSNLTHSIIMGMDECIDTEDVLGGFYGKDDPCLPAVW